MHPPPRLRVLLAVLLPALLLLALAGCDAADEDDETPEVAPGTFAGTVDGEAFAGRAFYALTAIDDGDGGRVDVFVLGLVRVAGGDTAAVSLVRPAASPPPAGRYDVVNAGSLLAPGGSTLDPDLDGFVGLYAPDVRATALTDLVLSTGGEVRLTAAGAGRVAGTFDFDAVALNGTDAVTLAGTFDAAEADDVDVLPLDF